MLRFLTLAIAALAISLVLPGTTKAHHSWKCPPATNITIGAIDGPSKITLLVDVRNTCACSVKIRTGLPGWPKKKWQSKWVKPGAHHVFRMKSESTDLKALFDWRTHDNRVPC